MTTTTPTERDAVAVIAALHRILAATPANVPFRSSAVVCAEDAEHCLERGAHYHARLRAERGLTHLLGFSSAGVVEDALRVAEAEVPVAFELERGQRGW